MIFSVTIGKTGLKDYLILTLDQIGCHLDS